MTEQLHFHFSGGSAGKESSCNAGDLGSMPGIGRSPWRRERLPTPVFWPGEFHRLYSPWGRRKSETTEQLALSLFSDLPKAPPPNNITLGIKALTSSFGGIQTFSPQHR